MKTLNFTQSAIAFGLAVYALSSPVSSLAQEHSGHDMSNMSHAEMDHGADKKPAKAKVPPKKKPASAKKAESAAPAEAPAMDHSQHGMDHSQMKGMDHSKMQGMDHGNMAAPATSPNADKSVPGQDHSMHQHAMPPAATDKAAPSSTMPAMQHSSTDMKMGPMQGGSAPPDARDPDAYANGLKPHAMHGMDMADDAHFGRVMINELEATHRSGHNGQNLNAEAWYGGDINKAWLKVDGERSNGKLEEARSEILWDRVFATFWSTQMGLRHDNGTGPSRNWAAFGVRGLAPYWFETEATAYVGSGGMLAARGEARYELLLTQRLILEPKIEINLFNKNDVARGVGSGLSDAGFDLRLRYEVRRQFAPYVGVTWKRKFGNTADFARLAGEDVKETRVVAGVRMWF